MQTVIINDTVVEIDHSANDLMGAFGVTQEQLKKSFNLVNQRGYSYSTCPVKILTEAGASVLLFFAAMGLVGFHKEISEKEVAAGRAVWVERDE